MGTGSPFTPCSQLSSHGLVQTLPQMAGNGLAWRITLTASSNLLFAIRLTYAFTLTPAGHALEHSGIPLISIVYFLSFTLITPLSSPIKDLALKIAPGLFFVFRSNPRP